MIKTKKKKRLIFYTWWNKIRQYDFRQAFEKIFFTMIGLWLALALNNWNDSIRKKNDERVMLLQLDAALQQDIKDINETIDGYQYRLNGCNIVLENLNKSSLVTDTLQSALQALNGYSFLAANKGVYETFKSRGLDLIHNDTLRLQIVSLYEVEYFITERTEGFFQKVYTDQTLPYLFRHMTRTPVGIKPVDWSTTRNDNYFRELINSIQYNNQNLLDKYQALRTAAISLRQDILYEIDHL